MESKPYLIFYLDQLPYAIEAKLVKEIFPLPELTPLPEAPTDIIGILNLRGEILPVMHLALRLGRSAVSCRLDDQIIVLDWQGISIGMVVDRVKDLQTIENTDIHIEPKYGRDHNINPAFIKGIAKLESELIVILDSETLIRQPDQVADLIWQNQIQQTDLHDDLNILIETVPLDKDNDQFFFSEDLSEETENDIAITQEEIPINAPLKFGTFYDRYCPQVSEIEKPTFRKRAENLQTRLIDITDATGLYPMAVVDLGGEYFGIDLKSIQEFTNIRNLTWIPCCPQHIVGNINLRGEIVTLVDIRGVLNLPSTTVKVGSQTVVVHIEDVVAGLPVDSVSDVLYVNPAEIKPTPITTDAAGFLQGTITINNRTLSILDLTKMMGGLVVNGE